MSTSTRPERGTLPRELDGTHSRPPDKKGYAYKIISTDPDDLDGDPRNAELLEEQ